MSVLTYRAKKPQLSNSRDQFRARRVWLELGQAAVVEVTSEAEGYPIEGALLKDGQRVAAQWAGHAKAAGPRVMS